MAAAGAITKRPESAAPEPASLPELAAILTYEELIGALVARRQQLGLSQLALDHVAGWADGYTAKIEIGARPNLARNARALGRQSLPIILEALDTGLLLVPRRLLDNHGHPENALLMSVLRSGGMERLTAERGR